QWLAVSRSEDARLSSVADSAALEGQFSRRRIAWQLHSPRGSRGKVEMAGETGLIVSVSGIRGVIGRSLTPESATAFAAALGTVVEGRRVVLSRDGRPSGTMLRHAVLAGLLSAGCEVQDLGVASTPTFGL